MRKLNKDKWFTEINNTTGYHFLTERIKNDINGNRRYSVDVIKKHEYLATYTVQAYSPEDAVEQIFNIIEE